MYEDLRTLDLCRHRVVVGTSQENSIIWINLRLRGTTKPFYWIYTTNDLRFTTNVTIIITQSLENGIRLVN